MTRLRLTDADVEWTAVRAQGVVVIKAQEQRSLALNRRAALARLQALVDAAAAVPRRRIATQPTLGSRQRRLQVKRERSAVKALRGRVTSE